MFSDTTSTLSLVGVVVTVLTAASVVLAGVFFSSKSRGTKEALESLGETNRSMDEALKFERTERIRDREECAREIANLTGQIEVLQKRQLETFLTKVEGSIVTAVTTAVTTAVAAGVSAGVKAAKQ